MGDSVVLGIIGIASGLVGILATILNKLIDVLQKNIETNASVAAAIIANTNELRDHDEEVGRVVADMKPALETISKLPKWMESISKLQERILSIPKS